MTQLKQMNRVHKRSYFVIRKSSESRGSNTEGWGSKVEGRSLRAITYGFGGKGFFITKTASALLPVKIQPPTATTLIRKLPWVSFWKESVGKSLDRRTDRRQQTTDHDGLLWGCRTLRRPSVSFYKKKNLLIASEFGFSIYNHKRWRRAEEKGQTFPLRVLWFIEADLGYWRNLWDDFLPSLHLWTRWTTHKNCFFCTCIYEKGLFNLSKRIGSRNLITSNFAKMKDT